MPIQVTCAKCLTRFNVNEKFAGKKGPCPKCKAEIVIPKLEEQVVVHAPDDAPKDSTGKSVLKPIKRVEVEISRNSVFISIGIVLLLVAIALAMGYTGGTPLIARIVFGLLLAPPLVWIGYAITRDPELEGYTGSELWTRVAITSAILAATWLIYTFIPAYVLDLDYASEVGLMGAGLTLVIMLVLGAIAAMIAFELEFLGGLTIAGIYIVPTLVLALLAGVKLATNS